MRSGIALAETTEGCFTDAAPWAGGCAPVRERECRRLLDLLRETGVVPLRRRYAAGESLESGGEWRGELCVVMEGVVRVFGRYAGYAGRKQATLGMLGPWELYGYPVFAGKGGTAYAEAFTDCEVVKIPGTFLRRAVKRRPETALAMFTVLDGALSDREEMAGCLLPRGTGARLAGLLFILAEKFGEAGEEDHTVISLRLTRSDLAAMIAATRESVNHAVQNLRERRVLEMEGGRVTILDPKSLAELAGR